MKWDDSEYRPLNEKIIKAFFNVHNTLGPGFLERVYHNALLIELKKLGLKADSEKRFPVPYDNEEVGEYYPDIVVEEKVVVELKASKGLNNDNKAQLIAQLRTTKLLIGFLTNFGLAELEFKRLDNYYEIKKQGLWI